MGNNTLEWIGAGLDRHKYKVIIFIYGTFFAS